MLGPWSAGSGLQLLMSSANRALAWPAGRQVIGGPVAVARALERAARRFGVEIRTNCAVARIDVTDDRATGVTLDDGEHIEAKGVVSGLDPKRTFLTLCDADHLPPEFLWRIKHYRCRGTLAKVNLALSSLPSFTGATREMLRGRVRIAPDLDYLERAFDHAKYGRFSPEPWIEFTIPSLADPSLAPQGAHVLSAYAQFAPYSLREGDWDTSRAALGAGGDSRTVDVCARFVVVDRRHGGPDAARPGARLGTDGRTHLPWRAVARSVLHDASTARLRPVSVADQEPVSLRIWRASGHGVDGRFRPERRARDSARAQLATDQSDASTSIVEAIFKELVMRVVGVLSLASFVGLSSLAFAQAVTPGQTAQTPQPPPSTTTPQRMPARPLRPGEQPPKGTSIIKGQVRAAGTGAPVRRAQVRAMSMEGRGGGVTNTDNEGNFEIKELPAGRYNMSASKGGFVIGTFGQRRPGEPGTPIDLATARPLSE